MLCGMLRWNYDIRCAFYVIKYDDSKCLRGCGSEWCQRVSTCCSDSGSVLFLLIISALRQVGCETVGHLVTNASSIYSNLLFMDFFVSLTPVEL